MESNLEIRVDGNAIWVKKNQRLEALKAKQIPGREEQSTPAAMSRHEVEKLLDLGLHKAAKERNVDDFIGELERVSTARQLPVSAILEHVSPSGDSLLHAAVSYGNEEVVELIASHFPFLIAQGNIKGDTPLHVAAEAGRLNITKTLVHYGNHFPGTNRAATSSNHNKGSSSSSHNNYNHRLLRRKNVNGNTALHLAVMKHHHETVQFLVSADPEVAYYQNKEGRSPLFMAVKTGHLQILTPLLQAMVVDHSSFERLQGNSPVHAAIMERNLEMLKEIATQKPELLQLRDGKGGTPLHFAALMGYLPGVKYLLENCGASAFERNAQGAFPIHLACQNGHVKIIEELLQQWPDAKELLNSEGQNILHVAAKCGKNKVVKYILKTPSLGQLVNEKDRNGNTPLHLASMHWHPMIVTSLTWDKRVDVNIVNNQCFTALDVALQQSKGQRTFREKKTIQVLKSAGSRRSLDLKIVKQRGQISNRFEPLQMDWIKGRIDTLLLVETLVATMTFTAGFTLPGGYNGCDCSDSGLATMLNKGMFQLFVICDALSLYASIIAIVTLIWAQLGDPYLAFSAYTLSKHLFGLALGLMSLTFMAALYLAISKLTWLVVVVLIMGSIFLIIFIMHFIALVFPHGSPARFMRYISYYINLVLIPASGSSIRLPAAQHPKEFLSMNEGNREESQQVKGDRWEHR